LKIFFRTLPVVTGSDQLPDDRHPSEAPTLILASGATIRGVCLSVNLVAKPAGAPASRSLNDDQPAGTESEKPPGRVR